MCIRDSQNGDCFTRVYYNGPYDDRPDTTRPPVLADNVQLAISPNPNQGVFEIALKGNIYGTIDARIYNSLGQVVFRKSFAKTVTESDQQLAMKNLPNGLYFLMLNSSDLNKAGTRFVIQH